jgi:hypothetical protein
MPFPRRLSGTRPVEGLIQMPVPPDDTRTRRIVYSVPGMERVKVQRGLVFRTADGEDLQMDVYAPDEAPIVRAKSSPARSNSSARRSRPDNTRACGTLRYARRTSAGSGLPMLLNVYA